MTTGETTIGPDGSAAVESLAVGLRYVWLAGLGVIGLAEESTGRAFKVLVEKGEKFEVRAKAGAKAAGEKVGAAVGRAVKSMQQTVDERVAAAVARLSVPTRQEIEDLNRRIDEITARIDSLLAGKQNPETEV